MRFPSFGLWAFANVAASLPTFHSRSPYTAGNTTVQSAQDALTFAFTYGYPLYSFGDLLQTDEGEPPVPPNHLLHQRALHTAEDRRIVRPNTDTLYTNLFIDLFIVDLEVTVPDFGDRYGVWPFYDLYGNNLANIGSVANVTCGKFLLRYDQDKLGISTNNTDDYDGVIGMPMPYGQSIVRIVTINTTEDLEIVHTLQDQLKIRPIPRAAGSKPFAPPFDLEMFQDTFYRAGNDTSLPEAVMRLTATLAPLNEPGVSSDRIWVAEILRNAGCQNGVWTQPQDTNLTAVVSAATKALLDSQIIGDFHSFYQARYFVADWGYLAMTADQSMYPLYEESTEIIADQAILVQFSSRPVLKERGFWSITVYGEDLFLVPNQLNRFTLGDRSNLTFFDGIMVYPKDGGAISDGSFDILIQPEDVTPPENWTSNWLPAQAGGGAVIWTLRWYGAEGAMDAGGSYEYPTVTLIDAIWG